MKIFLFSLFTLIVFVLPVSGHTARTEGIAAVVNEEAVSASDLEARLRLVIVSSGLPNTQEVRENLRPQILNTLIDERLKMQEAARLEITIPPEEVAVHFGSIAQRNNMTPEEFTQILGRQGLEKSTLEHQIKSQIAWARVIRDELRPQINISENEISATLERIKGDVGKSQYLLSEIFLPVENPKEEENVKALADRLIKQMMQGKVPFPKLAEQFSQAPSAARGGDRGWVQEGLLSPELDEKLREMTDGDLSRPIRTLSGYHILLVRKKDSFAVEAMPSRDTIASQLGMERLERLQHRHLSNLKGAAFIERREENK